MIHPFQQVSGRTLKDGENKFDPDVQARIDEIDKNSPE
jgi:hypothetical protein